MIVVVDEREIVVNGYRSMFERLGYPTVGYNTAGFKVFADGGFSDAGESITAVIVGDFDEESFDIFAWKQSSGVPVIATLDQSSLTTTLSCFDRGADDVVRKPTHAQEIIARIAAIRRRGAAAPNFHQIQNLTIYHDGRDPEIDGKPFPLPRRERRVLEYLASIGRRRATREQVYNAVYGVMEQNIEESVVESHISKLRKKLKSTLGFDVIDSKRFLGYRLIGSNANELHGLAPGSARAA
ncbi:MAG: response regulator transcription factor [Pseudomonadota bacterium]